MGKVNNPYNFNPEQDYNSYSDIVNEENKYNIIITIGNGTGIFSFVYGYRNKSPELLIGSLNKNTFMSEFNTFANDIDDNICISFSDKNIGNQIKVESSQGIGILTYNSQYNAYYGDIPSLIDYFKNNVGSKFMCNISII